MGDVGTVDAGCQCMLHYSSPAGLELKLLSADTLNLKRMGSSLRPTVACLACLTIKIVMNQSVCLFSNQLLLKKKKKSAFITHHYAPGLGWRSLMSVCINAAYWSNALFYMTATDILHSSVIREYSHQLVFSILPCLENCLPSQATPSLLLTIQSFPDQTGDF